MTVHIFGIRHHGPGSARSLRQALERLQPDCILVEGPPDADDLLPLMALPAMQPPVALLVYDPDAPKRAAYYPFALFSPEWQALRYGLERAIPTRFMDLPQSFSFALYEEALQELILPQVPEALDETETPADSEAAGDGWISHPNKRLSIPSASIRCGRWRKRRATTTANVGGSIWSSSASTAATCSRRCSKP